MYLYRRMRQYEKSTNEKNMYNCGYFDYLRCRNDPLITKSYLDSYVSSLNITDDAQVGYEKVTLSKGSTMVGQAGTEIMLYSGNANAYAKNADIVNLTMGEVVGDGMSLGKYCIYLCPDADAGITATSDVVVFVKGKYSSN